MPAQQIDQIPEMELAALVVLMKAAFGILTEAVDGKPYAVRFVGKPFNTFVEDCRSLQVFTHGRKMSVSPLCIKGVLAKFDIPEKQFLEHLNNPKPNKPFPPEHESEAPVVVRKPN